MSFKHKSERQVIIPSDERSRETFVQLQLLLQGSGLWAAIKIGLALIVNNNFPELALQLF